MNAKNGNRLFWIALIFVVIAAVSIFGGSFKRGSDNVEPKNTVVAEEENSVFNSIFRPDDQVIQRLIDRAKGFEKYDMDWYWDSQKLSITENKLATASSYPPIVTLVGPRGLMLSEANESFQRMDSPTVDELRDKIQEGVVYFRTKAYRKFSDLGEFHMVLKQGDKVLQPLIDYKIDGEKDRVTYAKNSIGSGDFTREEGHVAFKLDEDFDGPLTFVFLYDGKDDYAEYEFGTDMFFK